MKVFEVITEKFEGDKKDIVRTRQYVECDTNQLIDVAIYFDKECREYGSELVGIYESLIIAQHIKVRKKE